MSSDSGSRPSSQPDRPDRDSWFDDVFGRRDRSGDGDPASSPTAADPRGSDPAEGWDPFGGPPTQELPAFGDLGGPTSETRPSWVSGGVSSHPDGFGGPPGPVATGGHPGWGAPSSGPVGWSYPTAVDPRVTAPAAFAPAPRRPRRRGTVARTVAVAALVALVVGGAAGYGGYRLGARDLPVAGPSLASPAGTGSAAPRSSAVAVARAVLPSTVTIQVTGAAGTGTGSGFVYDDRGHILTNNHVVSAGGGDGRLLIELSDGTSVIGSVVGRSPSYDLAVVRVDDASRLTPVRFGDSDAVQVGETALAVGSPLGLGGTVTEGIISATHRPVAVDENSDADAPSAYIDALQTDAAINPGNSGGPLVDDSGRVIGVNSAILTLGSGTGSQQSGNIGLGFAIPIDQARTVAAELISRGVATYPVLGAGVTDGQTDAGAVLQSVEPGQPAAQAGLQVGDVVTALDGRRVSRAQELIVAVRSHRPGDRVSVTYDRGGVTARTTVTLGSREG
ncbi:putative serine protease PepD [Friedmanniella endophytica]|uniref:Putative serine protease PepD n=1 Tax=Microlunatus kandeliicorticis TaxID=1759536 RepID=A0A7W3ISJ8_9ACTN|nr:putative serine protease PepD [Microlunatus kandeliicorticis]